MAEQIIVFDTTLRDGEQAPGINLNAKAKVEIAEQLARLGVDVIEAGFPQASPGDFAAVRAVAERVKGALAYWDGQTHLHAFSLPKFIRRAIEAQTRIVTDAHLLIVS